jgi:hypothetical protein
MSISIDQCGPPPPPILHLPAPLAHTRKRPPPTSRARGHNTLSALSALPVHPLEGAELSDPLCGHFAWRAPRTSSSHSGGKSPVDPYNSDFFNSPITLTDVAPTFQKLICYYYTYVTYPFHPVLRVHFITS